MFVHALQHMGFPGPIYAINPRLQEVLGLPCYPSLLDVPGPVDHVISSIPASGVLELMDHAAAKGVHSVHFFTAGFRETGDEERAALEQEMLRRARAAGVRIIGPNCMGLYCPAAKVAFSRDSPKESGNVAFISQSGLNAEEMITYSSLRGIRFSKVVSYGNAVDLDESDFLEYCALDPETSVITTYIEGVEDGRRFLKALSAASAAKPTIVLKGGVTGAGSRAADSHTGSLAGSAAVWESACRQAGALTVQTLAELEDMAVAFSFLKRPAGRGVAIMGIGGGSSVLSADAAEREGLRVPALSEELQAKLRQFTPVAGTSVRNPLDTVGISAGEQFQEAVRIVASSPDIHLLLIQSRIDWSPGRDRDSMEFVAQGVEALVEAAKVAGKPVVAVIWPPTSVETMARVLAFQDRCARAGLPVFWGVHRALHAVSRLIEWQDARSYPRNGDAEAKESLHTSSVYLSVEENTL